MISENKIWIALPFLALTKKGRLNHICLRALDIGRPWTLNRRAKLPGGCVVGTMIRTYIWKVPVPPRRLVEGLICGII